MAVAGAGAEIMDKGGAGQKPNNFGSATLILWSKLPDLGNLAIFSLLT